MQTTDEETNMRQLFGEVGEVVAVAPEAATTPSATPADTPAGAEGPVEAARAQARPTPAALTEAQALRELPAIPLHFASSYALVKPYVDGFESNLLDAPSLKHVRINRDWRPPTVERSARVARAAKP
jgi:hypothetical protein